jgi:hypothetical protein
MLSAPLIRHQVGQQSQPIDERVLVPILMVKAFHHKELAVNRVVRLVKVRAARWHLGILEHRIPSRFLVLAPLSHPLTVDLTGLTADGMSTMAHLLTSGKDPHTFALATAKEQGGKLMAAPLAHLRRDRLAFPRQFPHRVKPAGAQPGFGNQPPQAVASAFDASGEHALALRGGIMLEGRLTQSAIGLLKGSGTRIPARAPMPDSRGPGPSWAGTPCRPGNGYVFHRPENTPVGAAHSVSGPPRGSSGLRHRATERWPSGRRGKSSRTGPTSIPHG